MMYSWSKKQQFSLLFFGFSSENITYDCGEMLGYRDHLLEISLQELLGLLEQNRALDDRMSQKLMDVEQKHRLNV
jgi:hypothetical protein